MDKANSTRLRQIMEQEGGVLPREFVPAILSKIDFYKGIYGFVQHLQNVIGGNMASVDTGLPVIQFELIPELEKKMNMICGHLILLCML